MRAQPIRMTVHQDRVYSGEIDITLITRYTERVGKQSMNPFLIIAHGAGQTPDMVWRLESSRNALTTLAQDFSICIAELGGTHTWANDLSINRMWWVHNYLESRYGPTGMRTGIIGQSMGGAVAMAYALRYPSRVAFVGGQIPMMDIADVKVSRPELASSIDAAYPGGYSNATYGAEHSPVRMFSGGVSTLRHDLPIKIWSASDDIVVRPAPLHSFLEYRPQTEHMNLGALGHSDAAMTAAWPDTINWCRQFIPEMQKGF